MKTTNNFADITIAISWETSISSHKDITHIQRVNIFRDFLYEYEPDLFFELEKGQTINADKYFLKDYFKYETSKILKIKKKDIKPLKHGELPVIPKKGRFYPRGILSGVTNVFTANMHPFRCLDIENDTLFCDLNNPLNGKAPEIQVKIENIIKKERDSGASCRHLLEEIVTGPGMQARYHNRPTDFFTHSAFSKNLIEPDEKFYEKPRITAHTDLLCRKHMESIYSRLILPDKNVLDLMSSVYSHLPTDRYLTVTGLGMNMKELFENKTLSKRIVQNINENHKLPFDNNSFDYAVCSMSVEYLSNPFEIFKEVYRILRPGGLFIVSFSNRWFPGKEIKIWNELHDFEKMGLVLEYFYNTKGFKNCGTISMRGFPRPYDKNDRYKDTLWFSDPLFVVYGEK
ncbi:MAG: class I SAM-dependent methyltransferase [Desulforegulaceae bacterium]|nr:class I SAM-dependent methyltransferase [Desulforegulaceae bacterium]